jgi:hypothetical protein
VNEVEVLSQASPDILNALPPKLGVLYPARFGLDCKHGIPGVRSVDSDDETALRNALDSAKRIEDNAGHFAAVRNCRPSLFVASSCGPGSSASFASAIARGGAVSLAGEGSSEVLAVAGSLCSTTATRGVGGASSAAGLVSAKSKPTSEVFRALGVQLAQEVQQVDQRTA